MTQSIWKLKQKIKNEKGQSMVEMALVLPILILIVFGIIEFGRAFNAQLVITSAAREGARKGAITADITDAQTKAADVASVLGIASGDVQASISGEMITVTVPYTYEPVTFIIPADLNLSATSKMRVE